MSQTFNLGGLGDNKLTKLIFSNGTANTCSIFLDDNGYLVFEQGANTVTFPLGELPADKRLAIEDGIVVEGRDVVNTGNIDDDDNQNQNNLVVDLTEDALTNAVADALGVENLFSAKSEPQAGDGVYPGFTNAMYFNGSSDYLSWTPAADGNNKTWTWSSWVKRSSLGRNTIFGCGNDNNWSDQITFYDDSLMPYFKQDDISVGYATTSALFRDTSAWYHIVIALDVTQSEDSNVIRIYVNGVLQTSFINYHIHTDPAFSSTGTLFNKNRLHRIGKNWDGQDWYFNGYMANLQFIDGQALDVSDLGQYLQVDGEETNIWIPKPLDPSIDYGANGFYLDFSRNRLNGSGEIDMVHDVAPLTGTHTVANDWTAN